MGMSVLDFINSAIAAEENEITLDEWITIRRNGDPSEIAEAVQRMELAGGYDNLQ